MTSPRKKHWVGFDLGGTKMMSAVFNEEFRTLGRKRRKTKGLEGAKVGMERIIETIRDALEEAKLKDDDIAGIGIGCPGNVDLDRGVILDTANLSWKNVHVKSMLEEAFGAPTVILNDVDAGVYGEYRFGSGKNARCLVGVFPGTGIGGGCVYQGEIIRGKTMSCFEIGHMQVSPGGLLCGCGRIGCLETEASRLAIASAAAAAAFRGEAPNLFKVAGTDVAAIRSSVLAQAIKDGDKVVEQIVIRAARLIGSAVGDVANLLAPDIVVLGGGLVEAMPQLFVSHVEEAAKNRAAPPVAKSFKVVAARLADEAVVRGAAAWAEKSQALESAAK
ncbi:MAG: ROK family protein [Pirellulaceae bacterium]|nr:ROK family protein [Pirellulaceae bacterium]